MLEEFTWKLFMRGFWLAPAYTWLLEAGLGLLLVSVYIFLRRSGRITPGRGWLRDMVLLPLVYLLVVHVLNSLPL